MTNNKLFVYTRKSKNEDRFSIDMQLDAAEKIKNDLGFTELVHLNEGQGVSGASELIDREKASFLMDLIEKGECKHLYLYEWSRISIDDYESALFRRLLVKNDVLVYTAHKTEPTDLSNNTDEFITEVMSAIDNFTRLRMARRKKESMKQTRKVPV